MPSKYPDKHDINDDCCTDIMAFVRLYYGWFRLDHIAILSILVMCSEGRSIECRHTCTCACMTYERKNPITYNVASALISSRNDFRSQCNVPSIVLVPLRELKEEGTVSEKFTRWNVRGRYCKGPWSVLINLKISFLIIIQFILYIEENSVRQLALYNVLSLDE